MTAQRAGAFALILIVSIVAVGAVRLALPSPSNAAAFVGQASLNSVMMRENARLNGSCDGAPFWVGPTGMTSEIDTPPRVCPDADDLAG